MIAFSCVDRAAQTPAFARTRRPSQVDSSAVMHACPLECRATQRWAARHATKACEENYLQDLSKASRIFSKFKLCVFTYAEIVKCHRNDRRVVYWGGGDHFRFVWWHFLFDSFLVGLRSPGFVAVKLVLGIAFSSSFIRFDAALVDAPIWLSGGGSGGDRVIWGIFCEVNCGRGRVGTRFFLERAWIFGEICGEKNF